MPKFLAVVKKTIIEERRVIVDAADKEEAQSKVIENVENLDWDCDGDDADYDAVVQKATKEDLEDPTYTVLEDDEGEE